MTSPSATSFTSNSSACFGRPWEAADVSLTCTPYCDLVIIDQVQDPAEPSVPTTRAPSAPAHGQESNARRLLDEVARRLEAQEERTRSIPDATPPGEHRTLCIGMATFDDYAGVWSTIQAMRISQPEILDRTSFLVLDNHPEGPDAEHLKALDECIPHLRYVPFRGFRSTAVRDLIFREANADVVLCVDCHVLLQPGALAAMLDWFERHPTSRDLIHGPLLGDDLNGVHGSHFGASWGAGMFGQWERDERASDQTGEPFEVEMNGLGVFACRREAWPGLNPLFRGFGGEEGYLQEKFRRAGGRVLCHPALGWTHRFSRPNGVPYANTWNDRVRNYLVGWRELGWDMSAIATHFRELLDEREAAQLLTQARRDISSPFSLFDAIFCLNLNEQGDRWNEMSRRFEALGIAWRVERVPAVRTPENHHAGHALSFRKIVADARFRGYRNLLLVEDDAIFHDSTIDVLRAIEADLERRRWDLLYLGAAVWSQTFPFAPRSTVLQIPRGITCTHCVAVNEPAFDRILADIPAEPGAELEDWLAAHRGTDQYLNSLIEDGTFDALLASPRVATQPFLRESSDADEALSDRYVI